jgi:DeoR/GlpR family transcriptional regulator of sugar metabolism
MENPFRCLVPNLVERARDIRKKVILMNSGAGQGHTGGDLSEADILAPLFFHILRYQAPLNMLALQRGRKILELLQEEGSARVSVLSRLKNLSLQHLENMDKKERIGRAAATLLHDDSLILDSGSTVTEVARNLGSRKGLRIVTNALNVALLLGTEYSFEIMLTGGEFKPPTLSVAGEKATAFFDRLYVHASFLAVGGISLEAGFTYPGFADILVKKAMIEVASKVVLVADSTKIGQTLFASLGPVELTHYLVTDDGILSRDRETFEARGI